MYLNLGQSEPDRERQRKGLKRKNDICTFSLKNYYLKNSEKTCYKHSCTIWNNGE